MERYRAIIDDWDAFIEAVEQPPQTTVRKNPIKADDDFEQRLRAAFPETEVEQADWNSNLYRLPDVTNPGKSLLHWRGAYYVQEESAAVPVTVLNPEPGDTVLDMAAAPGGKTTQIAADIRNTGVVVANDANFNRLKSLHANTYRAGATSVVATNYDGQNMPEDQQYDKILVDAPCSGEGNEARRSFEPATDNQIDSLAGIQEQLLAKAERLLRPGGTVVYSTCTFAPRENEAVVAHALEHTALELAPIDLPVPHQSGVTRFNDATYPDKLAETARIYPHHLRSGGMYVAKLAKPV